MISLKERLQQEKDEEYRAFALSLLPNQDRSSFIGVRMPILRKIAGEYKDKLAESAFLTQLPHDSFEEMFVHICIIANIKDYDTLINEINTALPYINNWSLCDTMNPALFQKHPPLLRKQIDCWLNDAHPYTRRFAILCLMKYYLKESWFEVTDLEKVAQANMDHYYVQMMMAWYYATALAFHFEETFSFLARKELPPFVYGKSIQKAIESRRVSDEHKEQLRKIR